MRELNGPQLQRAREAGPPPRPGEMMLGCVPRTNDGIEEACQPWCRCLATHPRRPYASRLKRAVSTLHLVPIACVVLWALTRQSLAQEGYPSLRAEVRGGSPQRQPGDGAEDPEEPGAATHLEPRGRLSMYPELSLTVLWAYIQGFAYSPGGVRYNNSPTAGGPLRHGLFQEGVCVNLNGRLHATLWGTETRTFLSAGPLALVDSTFCDGGTGPAAGTGPSILAVRDLVFTRTLVGVHADLRARTDSRCFFVGAQVAGGIAYIRHVNGTLDLRSVGGGLNRVALYEDTWTYTWEIAGRLGWGAPLGRGVKVELVLLFGVGRVGPPRDDSSATNPLVTQWLGPARPSDLETYFIGAGLTVRIPNHAGSGPDSEVPLRNSQRDR